MHLGNRALVEVALDEVAEVECVGAEGLHLPAVDLGTSIRGEQTATNDKEAQSFPIGGGDVHAQDPGVLVLRPPRVRSWRQLWRGRRLLLHVAAVTVPLVHLCIRRSNSPLALLYSRLAPAAPSQPHPATNNPHKQGPFGIHNTQTPNSQPAPHT